MNKKEYKYECVKCEFYTNARSAFEKHLITEKHKTGEKAIRCDKKYPDKCEMCNYKPSGNMNYIQHKLNIHSTPEEREKEFKFYCKNCDFGTFSKNIYETHLKTKKHIQMNTN